MRSLIVAIILFIIIVSAVVVNSIYVCRLLGNIERISAEISSTVGKSAASAISDLESTWSSNRTIISLSVESGRIERMDELIISLKSALSAQSEHEVLRLCRLISELCREILVHQRLSFHGLF